MRAGTAEGLPKYPPFIAPFERVLEVAMINGIDVSGWQENIEWPSVPKATVGFVFAKATEGVDYYSNQFQQQHDGAKSLGIPFGAYHYLDPSTDGGSQANHFLNATNGFEGQLLPALDVEITGGQSVDEIVGCMSDFLKVVDPTLKGKRTLIYTFWSFWQDTMGGRNDFSGHPLWIAQYPVRYTPGMKASIPAGWTSAVLWQYADSGSVPGITGITKSPDMDLLISDDIGTISR
jgi:GH25 family lysozyme M1 (1,4-beta-N-acetylmuramidase)